MVKKAFYWFNLLSEKNEKFARSMSVYTEAIGSVQNKLKISQNRLGKVGEIISLNKD